MNWPLVVSGSAVTALATGFGAIPALWVHRLPARGQNALMGFSAGVMLSASSFSLINPALKMVVDGAAGEKTLQAFLIGLAILFGGAFLHLCNRYVPHEHFISGREGGPSSVHLKRIWLFVFAITLHNFPEGLAVGSGLGSQSLTLAMPIVIGIALQDLPEGFVVAAALISAGYSRRQGLWVAFLTGVVEAAAALLGFFATSVVTSLLPWALAFAGGAMIYVVSDEIIPESHRKEHASEATAGLLFGFVLMMVLDVALS